ncbi:MAG TPA: DoxX family protein [Deltaproteobacteria bacterium]|nr:DoxX family protein [Deltaproteobacteria bacterium]
MQWVTWSGLGRYRDLGVAIVRIGLGLMMMVHGWPKVAGGAAKWEGLGRAMGAVGIDFAPIFWGAAASFTEFFGGALIVIGLATRPAAALMVFTLFIASASHLNAGDGIAGASHAIETGLGFFALLFVGPGSLSVDGRLQRSS